jgi:hypothetical protein
MYLDHVKDAVDLGYSASKELEKQLRAELDAMAARIAQLERRLTLGE